MCECMWCASVHAHASTQAFGRAGGHAHVCAIAGATVYLYTCPYTPLAEVADRAIADRSAGWRLSGLHSLKKEVLIQQAAG